MTNGPGPPMREVRGRFVQGHCHCQCRILGLLLSINLTLMRDRYALPVLLALVLSTPLTAQTVLFQEDFEGASPAFTLNTTDVSSAAGGANTWLINNVYAGGSGTISCLGLPLPFTVPNTAAQPAGITSPNGNYLHTASTAAVSSGVLNCCFAAADGLCVQAGNNFARMNTDVSTVGAGTITLSFWWLCGGGTNNYGEVYYSTDQGASWTLITEAPNQYRNQTTWTQQNISLPAFQDQATLRFGFRFFNAVTLSAADPGFGVDDVRISSAQAAPNEVTTGLVAPLEVCAGGTLNVSYSIAGTFLAGNVFTAQLSDAAGSFSAPVGIGMLASTAAGTITCTVPPGTPPGTGYRVRVVASTPATTGSVNTADITVGDAPFAGTDESIALCKNTGSYDLFPFLGAGVSTCGSWIGPEGSPVSGTINTDTDNPGAYTYITDCPGGCPQDQATITVALINPANAGQDVTTALCSNAPPANLANLVVGGDATGFFFLGGLPFQTSQLSVPGTYDLLYVVFASAPCENDTAMFSITVNAPPNAGSSTTATVCVNDPPVDLLGLLGGTPDSGGTWTSPDGLPFGGVLDPATAPSGLYTYLVAGQAPCNDAQAFVAVVVDPCTGVAEHARAITVRWLGQHEGGLHTIAVEEQIPLSYQVYDDTGRLQMDRREADLVGNTASPCTDMLRAHTWCGCSPVMVPPRCA